MPVRPSGKRSIRVATATPTVEPTVPGATGNQPTGPTVAMRTAAPRGNSLNGGLNIIRAKPIAFLGFRVGWRRNAVSFSKPVVQIKQLASFAAEGTEWIPFPLRLPFTNGAVRCHESARSRIGFQPAQLQRPFSETDFSFRRKVAPQDAPPRRNPMKR